MIVCIYRLFNYDYFVFMLRGEETDIGGATLSSLEHAMNQLTTIILINCFFNEINKYGIIYWNSNPLLYSEGARAIRITAYKQV